MTLFFLTFRDGRRRVDVCLPRVQRHRVAFRLAAGEGTEEEKKQYFLLSDHFPFGKCQAFKIAVGGIRTYYFF